MTEVTTKSPSLTIEKAQAIIANLWGHTDWKVYRVVGSEVEGIARAKRDVDMNTGIGGDDRLYVINNGRIVSVC